MPRRHPRISLLKLAEYVDASAVRRRAIVKAQHSPPEQIVPQYRRATAAGISFLRSGGTDLYRLQRALETLRAREPKSEWDARDLENSAEAVEHLLHLVTKLSLGDRRLGRRRKMDVLTIQRVDVSVRPHVRLWQNDKKASVGAVKLCFSKTRPLPESEARRAATVMRRHLDLALAGTGVAADPNLCQVVDVFEEVVYSAPLYYKRTMREIGAACEEIRKVWPRPTAPDFPTDYPPSPAA